MRLYNTLTRQREDFVPADGKTVRMYACGLTVYARGHIGNFRTFISLDVLRRALRYVGGFDVRQVVNFTDVDDKTINGATREGVPLSTSLSTGEDRLFRIVVPQGQTLQVDLKSASAAAANTMFLRYGALPSGATYDAAYQGALQADQRALIPSTTAGTYYLLFAIDQEMEFA